MILLPIILLVFFSDALAKNVNSGNDADGPLDLTAYLERGEADKARKLSTVDPTLFAGVQSHAAFFNVDKTNKWHTFFWFFPAENKSLDSTPCIIWLGSGYGRSTLFDMFVELGPLQVENGTVSRTPDTWGSDYSLLFIDNPVEVGFSYSEDKHTLIDNEEQGGEALISFILQFIKVFPELQQAPVFIGGRFFGSRFGLAVGRILDQNSSIPINFRGFLIAENYVDPPSLLHYSDLITQLGFMEFGKVDEMRSYEDAARNAWIDGDVTEYLQNYAKVTRMMMTYIPKSINPCKYTEDKHNDSDTENFLTQPNVRSALHVGDVPFKMVNTNVSKHLTHELNLGRKKWFEDTLECYPILSYSGQLGFFTGYALAEQMYRELSWSGQKFYLKAERTPIQSKNPDKTLNPIGYVKASGFFMEVMIRSAGDSLPTGQPAAVKQVVEMFVEKFK